MNAYRNAAWRPDTEPCLAGIGELLVKLSQTSGDVIWEDRLVETSTLDTHFVRGIHHMDLCRDTSPIPNACRRVMEFLGMWTWFDASSIHRGLSELVSEFYAGRNDCVALVVFENRRELFVDRCREFSRQGTQIETRSCLNYRSKEIYTQPYGPHDNECASITAGIPLNLRYLQLQLPTEYDRRDLFVECTRNRRVVVHNSKEWDLGRWDIWQLARRGVDDKAIKQGLRTVHVSSFDNEVNPGRLMTWLDIDPNTLESFSICLDFDPWTERLITIRTVEMSLSDYILMDPRVYYWLLEAADFSFLSLTNARLFADQRENN